MEKWIASGHPLAFHPPINESEEVHRAFVDGVHLWIYNNLPPECQPEVEEEEDARWPIVRSSQNIGADIVEDKSWSKLMAKGPCGFFLFLMALHWWKFADSENKFGTKEEYMSTILDIRWILDEAIKHLDVLNAREPDSDKAKHDIVETSPRKSPIAKRRKIRTNG